MFEQKLINEEATVNAGSALGKQILGGAVVFLLGTLGAGKTTFCRGVLNSFQYSGPVKSPTYTLVEPYQLEGKIVYHFDLYRLADPEELEFMGIRDYFEQSSICLVEWPERGKGIIPESDLTVSLTPIEGGRQLKIESQTQRGAKILAKL